MTFQDLGVRDDLRRAIEEMGFESPMPVQEKVIPHLLSADGDVVALAQTGTGKTAAFGLPLLQRIDPELNATQALILSPTRELCLQIGGDLADFSKYMPEVRVLPVYGGSSIESQIKALRQGVQIIVATPGRLIDLINRGVVKLDHVHTVVLDEADEMLNMGFREDIETILKDTPGDRQTVLFSATMPRAIMEIAELYQREAVHVKVVKKELTVPNIEQYYYEVRPKNKDEVLCRLLDLYAPKLSLIFCNTKKKVDELVLELQNRGYFAEGLHGDLKQMQRDRVMQGFRDGNTDILVATDVAARGIDVDDVEAVFNYDLPQDDEYYVHRIGRTGRAGRQGKSFTFIVGREVYKLKDIQRYCRTRIQAQPIPSLDDVANMKVEHVFEKLEQVIAGEDLSSSIRAIEAYLNQSDRTAMDLAAAFLRAELGDSLEEQKDDLAGEMYQWETERRGKGRKGKEQMVRLYLSAGRKQKIKPGDVLGAITGESGMPGKAIGSIDMYDRYTFVDVPRKYYKQVLKSMKNKKIKGSRIYMEKAETK